MLKINGLYFLKESSLEVTKVTYSRLFLLLVIEISDFVDNYLRYQATSQAFLGKAKLEMGLLQDSSLITGRNLFLIDCIDQDHC